MSRLIQPAVLQSIPSLVHQRACTTPGKLAVSTDRDCLTYQELDERAERVAHQLRALGAGPDVVVAMWLDRSIELIVAALAILKTGASYLPLDPGSPLERVTFMLDDADVPILITEPRRPDAGRSGRCHVITLEAAAAPPVADERSVPMATAATEAALAYVIYTSGSTGQPKGVEITYGGLLNLIDWHQRAFSVTSADRATQLANPAFDAAVWEVWPYLTAGASVHIPDEETKLDPHRLRDWLVAWRISITFLPTPLAETVLTLDWPAATALRYLLTGGDRLHRHPPATLPFTVVNNYGPTEATVVATSGLVAPASGWTSPPSIGRPIDGVRAYVLDETQQPVAPGMTGELFVGGRGVARGYRKRAELTAERFLFDPFAAQPDGRMYRTGDLVRARADGELEFVGRSDDQVKIRGFRIELGEIEATLAVHPQVQQAAVIAREGVPGDKRLVAYVVPSAGAALSEDVLRPFLRTRLPDYMMPAAIMSLPALPMTSNGKVDRQALPEPVVARPLADDSAPGARTLIEQRVVEMVAALLNVERVGTEENFFLLGGHSLLGAQLLVRIQEAFGVELSLHTLFDQPTVAGLSAAIEQQLLARLEAMTDEEAERLLA